MVYIAVVTVKSVGLFTWPGHSSSSELRGGRMFINLCLDRRVNLLRVVHSEFRILFGAVNYLFLNYVVRLMFLLPCIIV